MILQPGYAKPYEQTPIYARVPGYVGEVNVDIGDQVRGPRHDAEGKEIEPGTLLAKLRVPELEKDVKAKEARVGQASAQVKQADASYEAAKANVKTTEAMVARSEAEYKRWTSELKRGEKLATGLVYDKQTLDEVLYQKEAANAGWEQAKAGVKESEARRDKAKADVDAARESLLVAQADRDQAQVWLNYRDIRAPYDGVITLRTVHTGHFLQTSSSGSTNKSAEPIFNIVRPDILRITVQVPEYDAPLVKEGAKAVVRFQGLKDEEIAGKVTRTTEILDNEARTLKVEIHLPNPDRKLRPGMKADAVIKDADRKLRPGMYVNVAIKVETPKVWTLPGDAIFTDGEKSYCFIVDQEKGKAIKTALKTGVRNDSLVEVLKKQARSEHAKDQAWEDVTGSELIVAANPESLIDGQEVTVAAPKNAPP
jgi:HlyD family secretion protein